MLTSCPPVAGPTGPDSTSTCLPGFCLRLKREFLVLWPRAGFTPAFGASKGSSDLAELVETSPVAPTGPFGLNLLLKREFLDLGVVCSKGLTIRAGTGRGWLTSRGEGAGREGCRKNSSGSPGWTTVGASVAIRPGNREENRCSASLADRPAVGTTGAPAGCSGPKLSSTLSLARLGTGARFSVSPTIFTFGMNFDVKMFFLLAGMAKSPALPGLLVSADSSLLLVASSSGVDLMGVARTVLAGSSGRA